MASGVAGSEESKALSGEGTVSSDELGRWVGAE